jgi:hypothetical protein
MMLSGLNESCDFLEITQYLVEIKGEENISENTKQIDVEFYLRFMYSQPNSHVKGHFL